MLITGFSDFFQNLLLKANIFSSSGKAEIQEVHSLIEQQNVQTIQQLQRAAKFLSTPNRLSNHNHDTSVMSVKKKSKSFVF